MTVRHPVAEGDGCTDARGVGAEQGFKCGEGAGVNTLSLRHLCRGDCCRCYCCLHRTNEAGDGRVDYGWVCQHSSHAYCPQSVLCIKALYCAAGDVALEGVGTDSICLPHRIVGCVKSAHIRSGLHGTDVYGCRLSVFYLKSRHIIRVPAIPSPFPE